MIKTSQKQASYGFKVILVGSGGVGKTCLFNRYCFNSFNINSEMTIGINFHSIYLPFKEDSVEEKEEEIKYVINSIFDFGGQDRFKSLMPSFLRGADGALLLFDSVSYSSFEKLDYWCKQIEKHVEREKNRRIPKFLIGCKSDLLETATESEIVSVESINDYMQEREINGFHYTSALKNHNVVHVFNEITRLLLEEREIDVTLL